MLIRVMLCFLGKVEGISRGIAVVELCAIAYVKSDVMLQLTTTGGPNY